MCRSMCIVLGLFLSSLPESQADYKSDIDELKNLFGRKIQQLESEQRALKFKLDVLEKREQQNNRSKRQVVGTVAFSAYLDHDVTNLGPDHTIQFHGVVLNEGNAYNPNTGIFTVPLDGVYFLTFAAEDYRFHREWLNLVVDGQLFSSTVFGAANGHFVGSNIVLARLTKGQSVWVAVDSRETTGGSLQGDNTERFTTFSGFYLYE